MAQTPLDLSPYLYGLHDEGGEALLGGRGTVLITEEIGADTNQKGRDYSRLGAAGLTVIVRLNYGYEPKGTIPPTDLYPRFAAAVAAFVRGSVGCVNWIIGNEPNYKVERPQLASGEREVITPALYAACFNQCARAIAQISGGHRVWLAAVAPWNINTTYPGNERGDWLIFFRDIIELTRGFAGGITIHTYTHGTSPALIGSKECMRDAPYQDRYYHFLAFTQFMAAIPAWARSLPVGITEADQNEPWADVNSGWVLAAYTTLNMWNENPANQPIQFMILYRWGKFAGQEGYSIHDRPQLQADIAGALAKGYRAKLPIGNAGEIGGAGGSNQYLPYLDSGVDTDPNPAPAPLPSYPAHWDSRLTDYGVKIVRAEAKPGDLVWRVTRGRWYSKSEAGGRRNAYVNVYGEAGERMIGATLVGKWPSGEARFDTENKPPGEPMGNFVLSPGKNAFSLWVESPAYPSDQVIGVGMGEDTPSGFNPGEHTASEFDWQLERVPQPQPLPQPPTKPKPPPAPVVITPPVERPLPKGIVNPYILEAILAVESNADGFNDDGSLKIRIEAHILATYLAPNVFAAYFRYDSTKAYYRPDPGAPWIAYHELGQRGEWQAFKTASALDRGAALMSISMGAPQIMGFHHKDIGYNSPEEMFTAFNRSEAVQLTGFFNFLLYKPGLWEAVQAGDFGGVARLYNGNEAVYRPLLEQAFRRFSGA